MNNQTVPGLSGLFLAAAVPIRVGASDLEIELAIRHLLQLKVCHVQVTTKKRKTVPRMNAGTFGIN